ncbi:MAG: 2-isopropylmalate synthase [Candidatus Omnitrophica bacterium]|nr:2-isopropylmalate synthase [Candidatus Omnitrophota bacterium]
MVKRGTGKKEKIIIFDTTLRDGEQCPGASLGTKEKLEIARQLALLGADVIEAGFPIASPGDLEAVKLVARNVKGPVICGLARSNKPDIDAAREALRLARRGRIHVFLATSKIHMKYKLRKAEGEILRLARQSVKYARRFTDDVEFSPEDASRSEREFLFRVLEAVIQAGAKTVNIPDTVGYAIPRQFGQLISQIRERVPNIHKAVISVHCHNDLGLGVSNSLEAVLNGARQVECTMNGLGERAGNASLEEIVMTIKTRKDVFKGMYTGINTRQICKTSRLVSKLTGMIVQPNKAIVGQNAFRHEAGIHQHGVLRKRTTYEIMRPEDVGFGGTSLVLGKHSGRHALEDRLRKLGYALSKAELDKIFLRFKELADKKKEVFNEDIAAIIEDEILVVPEIYSLEAVHTSSGTKTIPTATVRLRKGNEIFQDAACGDGPVDACCKTIDRITGIQCELLEYSLKAVTGGKDALGEVNVQVRAKNRVVTGRGASTDIIQASAKAYLNAINKLLFRKPPKVKGE